MIVDASAPTYMLTHWGRHRKRGPGLPLEYMVKRRDRRFLPLPRPRTPAARKRADINLIEFDRMTGLGPANIIA
jgi:N-acyl-D-aspartate/D-glutamate deacylase